MSARTSLLKNLVLKVCSPRVRHRLRAVYVSGQVVRGRRSSEREIEVLKLAVCHGDCVLDLGANIGVYTKELSGLAGPGGQVLACEPLPENFEILQRVIRKGNLSNVRAFQVAVGSCSGKREMVIPPSPDFSGYYLARFSESGDIGARETADVVTLDELWKKSIKQPLDFIKSDVEGAELEVVRGAREVIQTQRPGWLVEVRRKTSHEFFRLFNDLGYQAFVYTERLVRTGTYLDKKFSNYFFFHPESKVWLRVLPLFEVPQGSPAARPAYPGS